MLFVSPKEPLVSESLPDTSLHNERRSYETSSSCSSSCTPELECNTCSSCPSKLTKEQLALHREFLRLGSLLLADNVNLFHNALTVLSAQHDLKVATPATCVSDILPAPQRRSRPVDQSAGGKRTSCKYALPKEVAEKEFYQCMVCKERRTINSFATTHHTHEGNERSCVRWYCPLCDSFFAVTHRVYHVKCRHSDLLTVHPAFSSSSSSSKNSTESTTTKHPIAWKRTRTTEEEEEENDQVTFAPLEKIPHYDDEGLFSPESSLVSSYEPSTTNCSPTIDTFDNSECVSPLDDVFSTNSTSTTTSLLDIPEIPLFNTQSEEQLNY